VECTRPVHPPRRPRRTQRLEAGLREEELLKRVRKLEAVVEGLRDGSQIEKADGRKDVNRKNDEDKTVRLLAGNGRTRYVSDRFWASFSAEVSHFKFLPQLIPLFLSFSHFLLSWSRG